ncbi:hypothetical protein FAM09_02185 [Niastella caeni]|uniref:Uncharacterized protein n=1 Tax=Niastella caeni TaxID=2569763 RepID=A0A4V4H1L8_9BACT|nr:hypothetical protein [Niastella caeni]THU40946.1 hypothetical protein FAM09_02185 [Niastella caeni]
MKKRKERMKEGSNNCDKMECLRSGHPTRHAPTQNQQLPIKEKLTRRQVQSLNGNYAHTERAFQYNSAVLLWH